MRAGGDYLLEANRRGRIENVKINRRPLDLKNGKYEDRLFLQFLLLVMVPLIIMGVLSYQIYVQGETKRNRQALESYGESVSIEYDNLFSSIREYYLDSTSNTTFKWMLEQQKVPYSNYTEVRQAQNLLKGNYFMTKYISLYNFINVREGWILNNYGMYPYDYLKNYEETDQFLEEQKKVPLSVYWLNRTGVPAPYDKTVKESRMVDTSGEILVIKQQDSSGNLIYLLTVQVNTNALLNISQSYKKMGYDVAVLSNGSMLMETNPDFTESYLRRSGTEGQSDQQIYRSPEGRRYRVAVKEAGSHGLTYITGYDMAKMKRGGIVFVFAALGVMLLFGVILAVLKAAAVRFSQPILLLQKFVDDQNVQIKELFVANLVKGGLSPERITETKKKYQMESWQSYRMIGISRKPKADEGEITLQERERQNRELLSGLPEAVRESFYIVPIIYEHCIIFMIGENDDIALDDKTALVYKRIKDHAEEMYGCHIAFGISRPFHDLTHTRKAYEESSEALHSQNHNREEGISSLVLYDDYSLMAPVNNVYDLIMENELINAVDSCKEEEARRLLELILGRLEMKGASGIERNFYVTRLLTAIVDVLTKASLPINDVFDSEQYNILIKAAQIYDKKQLIQFVMDEIIRPITHSLTAFRQSGASDIVKQVTAMIKESRGNITLNECADALNYQPNYVSKVLKKERGVTFTDMVSEEKLKVAKYMLLTSDLSVAEISEKLQYNNVQNFIRFFKNHEETTPSAFRKKHKEG